MPTASSRRDCWIWREARIARRIRFSTSGKFVVRRLAPDSRKIELSEKAATRVEGRFLQAMAFDLASVHAAGSAGVAALRRDLNKRPRGWLYDAAKTAAAEVEEDFKEWKRR
jgi:hypothetical protein